jgi:uncharacterized protein YecE (DUF72 family)
MFLRRLRKYFVTHRELKEEIHRLRAQVGVLNFQISYLVDPEYAEELAENAKRLKRRG